MMMEGADLAIMIAVVVVVLLIINAVMLGAFLRLLGRHRSCRHALAQAVQDNRCLRDQLQIANADAKFSRDALQRHAENTL